MKTKILADFQICISVTLKVPSRKLHDNKYMIVSTQITNTEIFAFIAVLVFQLLNRKVLFKNRKDNRKNSKNKKIKKIANFTGKLPQKYILLECEIFRILLKLLSYHLSVLFQFA